MSEKKYSFNEFSILENKIKLINETSENGKTFKKIELTGIIPSPLVHNQNVSLEGNTLFIGMKGGQSGKSLADLVTEDSILQAEKIKYKFEEGARVSGNFKVVFRWEEYASNEKNLVPETAGGGILVGTGG